ncbi:MAG: 2-phosphosulfolactate phosphatase [Actinobacteria bacterium]|nr:2-phosphosulfolactate phosphatase [Actinomycetota bacterium]
MRFVTVPGGRAGDATGTVVVVDVLRAFTTAAVAFAGGAREILLVETVEDAMALRSQRHGALLMGEVGGLPVDEFDLSNSPVEADRADLADRVMVQRTTAGTSGAVNARGADRLIAASFVVAEGTVRQILGWAPDTVSFVITGAHSGRDAEEDLSCADYLAARLRGERPDPAPYLQRVRRSDAGRLFAQPEHAHLPPHDIDLACDIDRYNVALPIERADGHLVMRPAGP